MSDMLVLSTKPIYDVKPFSASFCRTTLKKEKLADLIAQRPKATHGPDDSVIYYNYWDKQDYQYMYENIYQEVEEGVGTSNWNTHNHVDYVVGRSSLGWC
jgi:hypothetical protein